jgi:hypothetical protein
MTLSPLLFGLVWTVVLTMFGVHLRRQAEAMAAASAAKGPPSQAPTVQYKEKV